VEIGVVMRSLAFVVGFVVAFAPGLVAGFEPGFA